MNSGGGSGKRKRGRAKDTVGTGTLALVASATVAAELSCITGCQARSFAGQPGTLVCVGTHAPTIELLLLTHGLPPNSSSHLQSLQRQETCLRPLARLLLDSLPQQLPDLWPPEGGPSDLPLHSVQAGAAGGTTVDYPQGSSRDISPMQQSVHIPAWHQREGRGISHRQSSLDGAGMVPCAQGHLRQWEEVQKLLGAAVGDDDVSTTAPDALQAQHDIPESVLLLPSHGNIDSCHVQVCPAASCRQIQIPIGNKYDSRPCSD